MVKNTRYKETEPWSPTVSFRKFVIKMTVTQVLRTHLFAQLTHLWRELRT